MQYHTKCTGTKFNTTLQLSIFFMQSYDPTHPPSSKKKQKTEQKQKSFPHLCMFMNKNKRIRFFNF